jgi:endonuclease III
MAEEVSMTDSKSRALVRAILNRYPQSFADAIKIDLTSNKPSPLFQWLIASLLFSTRIAAGQAENAARALFDEGWRTPEKMLKTSWEERVRILNRSGYARYDESTARYIADTTQLLLDTYKGDLRLLREAAGRNIEEERTRLKAFKGIGNVGADIFLREVQLAWEEVYPFADKKALKVAKDLGLGQNAEDLARLIDRKRDLPRLLSGLVRVSLAREKDEIFAQAA